MVIEDGFLSNENIRELQRAINALQGLGATTYQDYAACDEDDWTTAAGVDLSGAGLPWNLVQGGDNLALSVNQARIALRVSTPFEHDENPHVVGDIHAFYGVDVTDDSNVVANNDININIRMEFWRDAWMIALLGDDNIGGLNAFRTDYHGYVVGLNDMLDGGVLNDSRVMTPTDGGFLSAGLTAPGGGGITVTNGSEWRFRFSTVFRMWPD